MGAELSNRGGTVAWRWLAQGIGLALATMTAGCGGQDFSADTTAAPAGPPVSVSTRGVAVPPDIAQALSGAPAGARINYRLPDGRMLSLALGPSYESGLAVPCRIGRAAPGEEGGASPGGYAFCNSGSQWYQMNPVLMSGY